MHLNPGMLERLVGVVPLLMFANKEALDQVFALVRDTVKRIVIEIELSLNHVVDNLWFIAPWKWDLT